MSGIQPPLFSSTFVALNPKVLIPFAGLLICNACLSQNIEAGLKDSRDFLRRDVAGINGSVGLHTAWLTAGNAQPTLYQVLSASLSIDLFAKLSLPFNFVLNDKGLDFTHGLGRFRRPFNRFGCSPRYKGLVAHAGYRNLEFSEFTFSGITFLGAGVEYNDQRHLLSFTFFAGRLQRPRLVYTPTDSLQTRDDHRRFAVGVRLRAGRKNFAELGCVRIRDDVFSAGTRIIRELPQENMLVSARAAQTFFRVVVLSGEIALSLLTRDLYSPQHLSDRHAYLNRVFDVRQSTRGGLAGEAAIDINSEEIRYGLRYRRVGSDYSSLGCLFINNDVEDLSIHAGFTAKKLNVNASAGIQRNNLDRAQVYRARRLVASLRISWLLIENLNAFVALSNFSSGMSPVRDLSTDTVKMVHITSGASAGMNYNISGKRIGHTVVANVCIQRADAGDEVAGLGNVSLAHVITFPSTGFSIQSGLAYTSSGLAGAAGIRQFGPTAGISGAFLRGKWRLSLMAGTQVPLPPAAGAGGMKTANCGIFFIPRRSHNLRADLTVAHRRSLPAAPITAAARISLTYTYRFALKTTSIRKK